MACDTATPTGGHAYAIPSYGILPRRQRSPPDSLGIPAHHTRRVLLRRCFRVVQAGSSPAVDAVPQRLLGVWHCVWNERSVGERRPPHGGRVRAADIFCVLDRPTAVHQRVQAQRPRHPPAHGHGPPHRVALHLFSSCGHVVVGVGICLLPVRDAVLSIVGIPVGDAARAGVGADLVPLPTQLERQPRC